MMHPVHTGTPDTLSWFRRRNKIMRLQNRIGWTIAIGAGFAVAYVWLTIFEAL